MSVTLIAKRNMPSGLVAHYKLNDDALDSSGNGNNGVTTNLTYTTGKINNCGSFNGSSDKVFVENSSGEVWDGSSDISVSLWFKCVGSTGVVQRVFSHPATGTPGNRIYFSTSTNASTINFTRGSITTSSMPLALNTWYHVVMTSNSSTFKVYVNASTFAGPTSYTTTGARADMYMGTISGSNEFFNGYIDDVRIYNKALTPSEINDIYNYSRGTETSQTEEFNTEVTTSINNINSSISADKITSTIQVGQ
jgi:hypothetical protein